MHLETSSFLRSVKINYLRFGSLSEKQIEYFNKTVEELKMVQSGALSLEDVGTRGVDWPQLVNVTVNPAYDGMRARVQPYISEGTPSNFNSFVDWNSAALLSF